MFEARSGFSILGYFIYYFFFWRICGLLGLLPSVGLDVLAIRCFFLENLWTFACSVSIFFFFQILVQIFFILGVFFFLLESRTNNFFFRVFLILICGCS